MNFLTSNLLDSITDLSEKILKLFADLGIIKLSNLNNKSIYDFVFAGWMCSFITTAIILYFVLFFTKKSNITKKLFKDELSKPLAFITLLILTSIPFLILSQRFEEGTIFRTEVVSETVKEIIPDNKNLIESAKLFFAESGNDFQPSIFEEGDELKLKVKMKSGEEFEKLFSANNNTLSVEKGTENKVESVLQTTTKIKKSWFNIEEESEQTQFLIKIKSSDPFLNK
jgi:hypothetical protein